MLSRQKILLILATDKGVTAPCSLAAANTTGFFAELHIPLCSALSDTLLLLGWMKPESADEVGDGRGRQPWVHSGAPTFGQCLGHLLGHLLMCPGAM